VVTRGPKFHYEINVFTKYINAHSFTNVSSEMLFKLYSIFLASVSVSLHSIYRRATVELKHSAHKSVPAKNELAGIFIARKVLRVSTLKGYTVLSKSS
jgi:hypothetical protein